MWANWEVLEFLDWLAVHNQLLDEDDRIGFFGLDVYSLFESLEAVVDYLEDVDPDAAAEAREAYRCFEPYGEDAQEYAQALRMVPETCEDEVIDTLTQLQAAAPAYDHGRDDYFNAEQNALVAKNAEQYYREMARGNTDSWNVRDRHMVETLERLQSHHGSDSKGIIWAHNTHVGDARATDMEQRGRLNIGQLVRQHEGRSETALIGMGTYRGTVIAAESWNAPMEEMTVPPAQDGSYEHVFDRAGGHDQFLVTDDLDDDAALGQPRGIALSASCTIPTANPETTCRPSFPIATTRSSTSTKRVRSIRSPSTPTERTSRTSIRGDCDPIGPDFARDSAADREESRCRHRIELPVSRWSVAVAEQDGDFAPWTVKNSSRPFADGRTSSRTSRPNGDNGNAPDVLLSHPFCNGGYAVGSSGRYDICRGDFFDDFHCFKPETAQAPYKFIPFNYTTNWHDWPRVSFPVFTRRDIIHPRGWVQSPRPIGRGLPQSIGCARTGYYLIGRRTGLHDTRCLRLRDAVPVRSVGPPRPGGRCRERDSRPPRAGAS